MKASLILAAAGLVASFVSANAADQRATIYNGPMSVELPASLLRGSATTTSPAAADTAAPRKVRVVLQSPYGN